MHKTIATLAKRIQPIDDSFDPTSERELLFAEKELKVKFPELFREIQTVYGRCMFSGEALIHVDKAESLGIFTIFGCKGDAGNLLTDFRSHPDLQVSGLIPIADDMFNNRYVWNPINGFVLFIDYTDRKPPQQVAHDFEEFLNKIDVK